MTVPAMLARPLAKRVSGLPEACEWASDSAEIPDYVIHAAIDALRRGETHYTERQGILPLRELVAESDDDFNVEIKPKDVTITCGATEARFVALRVLARPGSQVVCPGDTARIMGAAYLCDVQLISTVDNPENVSVAYLTTRDAMQAFPIVQNLLEQAAAHNWWIIWDETPTYGDADFHPASKNPKLAPHVVTIDSLSFWMPGWRVGWMAGSEMAEKLRSFKQSMTICTTSVSQWAAVAMWESNDT